MNKEVLIMLKRHHADVVALKRLAETGKLVPFVGAGFSCSVGLPTWSAFLSECAKEGNVTTEVDALTKEGRYPEAAGVIRRALGNGELQKRIHAIFGDGKIAGKVAEEPLSLLPHLSRGLVATTNFDNVLESVFHSAGRPFGARHVGAKMHGAVLALTYDQHHLLKLHGTHEERPDRVLTDDEYVESYGGLSAEQVNITKLLPFLMVQLFASRQMLFLGCSLSNDLTMDLLATIKEKTDTVKHYALMPAHADQSQVGQRLLNAGIRPLWYPPEHRAEAITAVLRAILPAGEPTKAFRRAYAWLGWITFGAAMLALFHFQTKQINGNGPVAVILGLPVISILEIFLLAMAHRFAKTTPTQHATERLMPGLHAKMIGKWRGLRWLYWLGFVGIPLYVIGHLIHMQKKLSIIRLPTPEYNYHEKKVFPFPEFFNASSMDTGLLLDGPHYRWWDGGWQAYPFVQPWLQTILGCVALVYGLLFLVRCFTGWGCNKLNTSLVMEPDKVIDSRIDPPITHDR